MRIQAQIVNKLEESERDSREILRDLILAYGIDHGDVELSSGQKADIYYNIKRVSLRYQAWIRIGHIGALMCHNGARGYSLIETIGGPSLGSIPTSLAISAQYHEIYGKSLNIFYVRDSPITHGITKVIEGEVSLNTMIIDDVCTTGASILETARLVEKVKRVKVQNSLVVVNRGVNTAEFNNKHDILIRSIFTKDDFGG